MMTFSRSGVSAERRHYSKFETTALCRGAATPQARAVVGVPRSVLARDRARRARALLANCRFCAHDCGVNRLAGETGLCHAGAETRFFSAQTEVTDELELIPTFAIALSGCDLRCDFCITGASSWNPRSGDALVASRGGGAASALVRRGVAATQLAAKARAALGNGARTIIFSHELNFLPNAI